MIAIRAFLLIALSASITTSAVAGETEADKKLIKRIFSEVNLVPSLYAKDETPVKFGSLPKFTEKALKDYYFGKKEISALERDAWKANKEQYAKDFPVRAAVLLAAWECADVNELKMPLTLEPAVLPAGVFQEGKVRFPPLTSLQVGCLGGLGEVIATSYPDDPVGVKAKAEILKMQEPLGKAIFQIEAVQAKMKAAADQRDKEKSKRWQATFDLALARVQTDLIFLYEYSYALGQIRADKLPDLKAGEDGWKIAFQPKITITEPKAKSLAKERMKLLERIQQDHPGTPWAHFAGLEKNRNLGMTWMAKKK